MQLKLPPDLEALINKRLSSGAYTDAEDVLRRALEAQEAEESWTEEGTRCIIGPHRGRLPPSRTRRACQRRTGPCFPVGNGPASNHCRASRQTQSSPYPEAALVML